MWLQLPLCYLWAVAALGALPRVSLVLLELVRCSAHRSATQVSPRSLDVLPLWLQLPLT